MNNYSEAIKILSSCTDHRGLLFEIASKNPKAVVDAYERIHGPLIESLILSMKNAGVSKIECIKKYRALTSVGLKEAKSRVEAIAF